MFEDTLIMKNKIKILISIFIISLIPVLNQPLFAEPETLLTTLTLDDVREVLGKNRIFQGKTF